MWKNASDKVHVWSLEAARSWSHKHDSDEGMIKNLFICLNRQVHCQVTDFYILIILWEHSGQVLRIFDQIIFHCVVKYACNRKAGNLRYNLLCLNVIGWAGIVRFQERLRMWQIWHVILAGARWDDSQWHWAQGAWGRETCWVQWCWVRRHADRLVLWWSQHDGRYWTDQGDHVWSHIQRTTTDGNVWTEAHCCLQSVQKVRILY